jgi:hypothetical protein
MDVEEIINRACDYCWQSAAVPKDSRQYFSVLQKRDRFEMYLMDNLGGIRGNDLSAVLNALEILVQESRTGSSRFTTNQDSTAEQPLEKSDPGS